MFYTIIEASTIAKEILLLIRSCVPSIGSRPFDPPLDKTNEIRFFILSVMF